jgi:hypothetical protein
MGRAEFAEVNALSPANRLAIGRKLGSPNAWAFPLALPRTMHGLAVARDITQAADCADTM